MKKNFSYLLLSLATVIWGFAFVAQKAAVILPAFTVGAFRSIIAAVFLLLILPLTDKITANGRSFFSKKSPFDITKKELVVGSILGTILSVATSFQQIGLESIDAGKVAFITALYVVLVPVFSVIFGKKPPVNVWFALPVAVVGFYLISISPDMGLEIADFLVLICAIVFTFHILTVDRHSEGCDGVRLSLVQFAVAFIINLVLALIFNDPPELSTVLEAMPSLLFLGIGSSGIAYTLQILGQKRADASIASIILSMESVFGALGAALVFGSNLSIREYAGCGLVLFATIFAQIDFKLIAKKLKKQQ